MVFVFESPGFFFFGFFLEVMVGRFLKRRNQLTLTGTKISHNSPTYISRHYIFLINRHIIRNFEDMFLGWIHLLLLGETGPSVVDQAGMREEILLGVCSL